MFKYVQQLQVAKLKRQIARLSNQQHILNNPINELEDQASALEEFFKRGKSAYRGKQKFNVWERLVSQRDSYKKYQVWLSTYQSIPSQIEKLRQRIADQKRSIAMEKEDLQRGIDILNREISKVEQATNLSELGIAPQTAIEMLKLHNHKPISDDASNRTVMYQNSGENSEQSKKVVQDDVKVDKTTLNTKNGAESFFIDTKKLISLINMLTKNRGFIESVELYKQVRTKLDQLILFDGIDHAVTGNTDQIESFENEIYQAVGVRPTKIKHSATGFQETKTAKDIVDRIIVNCLEKTPNCRVQPVEDEQFIKKINKKADVKTVPVASYERTL